MAGIACAFYLEKENGLFETTFGSVSVGVVVGFVLGFFQWIVLRLQVRNSGLWILGSLVSTAFSAMATAPLITFMDKLDTLLSVNILGMIFELVFLFLFFPALIGFAYNICTGIVINWLLSLHIPNIHQLADIV